MITGKPTADNMLALIAAHKINSFFAPPTIWIAMLRSPISTRPIFRTLHKGYYGASIMPVEVLLELQRRLPNVKFWNFYGQTEIAPLATVLPPRISCARPVRPGKPALNVETRVVNDGCRTSNVGEVGEIVHRSPHLLSGYYNDPVRPRRRSRRLVPLAAILPTVDADGYITVVDRVKDMIKTGGENVASREVEEMVYRLPAVSEVAVVGLPDPRWIEAVTAIIVVKTARSSMPTRSSRTAPAQMAHFKVPKRVIFVDSLPKNPSGKLLKRELRQRFVGGETLDKAIQKNFAG